MLKLYYKIWVDGIVKLKSIPSNKGLWKFYSLAFISMAMALNIALIMSVLQTNIFHSHFYNFDLNLNFGRKLNGFLKFFILYLFVPLLLNYLLIFRNNRFEQLISRYKTYNGRLCITYLMISYFLPFVLLFIGWLFLETK